MRYLLNLQWMAVAALAAGFCSSAYAADKGALAKRLHNAAELSSLDDPALKPWHLKLDLQLYDAKGNPSEQGTIEEWWTPDSDKRVYDTPSYKATEIRNGNTAYKTKGASNVPYLLDAARMIVVHPIVPVDVIEKSELELQVQSFGKTKLDCIMLRKAGGSAVIRPIGQMQTYCFNQDNDQLRASWLDPEVVTIGSVGSFQGREVGVSSVITVSGVRAMSDRIDKLAGFSPDASLFTPGSDFEVRNGDPIWVGAAVMDQALVHKIVPQYPDEAKVKHTSGAVRMAVTIGKDGLVRNAEVVGDADPSLAGAALAAVKKFEYKPYLAEGVAVEVQTTVTMHFNFGVGVETRVFGR